MFEICSQMFGLTLSKAYPPLNQLAGNDKLMYSYIFYHIFQQALKTIN